MRHSRSTLIASALLVATSVPDEAGQSSSAMVRQPAARTALSVEGSATAPEAAQSYALVRVRDDLTAMQTFRPSYPFWRHIFTVPDGAVAFGSGVDGRLLATFPATGDWSRDALWEDPSLAAALSGRDLPPDLSERRDTVVRLLEPSVGPVVHNATRGLFLLPNARRYGTFLNEWGAIYERFGVPGELGLAQAVVESGLNGAVRSEAHAVGFCQWLQSNWRRLQRLAPYVIEARNQTTQAPYCAAYLTILVAKYGSFIPALSEHHTGGTNVGRTLINGERLGGTNVRARYFLGAEFARDLRNVSPGTFTDVYGTYGPRSFSYAEMIFGNMANVTRLASTTPQSQIFAVRTRRDVPLNEITRRAGLASDEILRFNPALARRVPAGATLYLPVYVPSFGRDVSFWHRAPTRAYASALDAFLTLEVGLDHWEDVAFDAVLQDFRRRFAATKTEEGTVMATMLAYVLEDRNSSREREILAEFRASARIQQMFDEARLQRDAFRGARTSIPGNTQ